jgi:hypothetical protein
MVRVHPPIFKDEKDQEKIYMRVDRSSGGAWARFLCVWGGGGKMGWGLKIVLQTDFTDKKWVFSS